MSPAPDWQTSLNTAVAGVTMQVTPENVLQVRKVLLAEGARLNGLSAREGMMTQYVGLCGGDPVSQQASTAFSQRVQLLVDQCKQYAQQLIDAGNALDGIAKKYGYTDEQLAASFNPKSVGLLS